MGYNEGEALAAPRDKQMIAWGELVIRTHAEPLQQGNGLP
jgi:hypothetical protein